MTAADASAAQLQREIEHRDQLLAAVYSRADTLQRTVELLERQLEAAIEAQREANTERAELRRLLGNAQLQVHRLLELPTGTPPDEERPSEPAPIEEHAAPAQASTPPPPPEPPRSAPRAQPRPRSAPRGLADEARGLWSNLRRMI